MTKANASAAIAGAFSVTNAFNTEKKLLFISKTSSFVKASLIMKVNISSIFADIPKQLPEELCQTLLSKASIRIERIVSKGHSSAKDFWYDQAQDEWVLLLQGQARLNFFDGHAIDLATGDYLLIPAHCKHQVAWTEQSTETVWLAIHIFDQGI